MKFLNIYILLAFTLVSININAQSDVKAKVLIKKVLTKINSQKSIRIKAQKSLLTATLKDEEITNLKTKKEVDYISDLTVSKNKFNITFSDLTFIDDGVNFFTIDNSEEEIVIEKSSLELNNNYDPIIELENLLEAFFIKKYNYYLFQFYDFKLGDKEDNDQTIFLQKKGENKSDYYVIINMESLQIIGLAKQWNIRRNKSMFSYMYSIETYKTNVKLPSNFFGIKKEKYKDYIID